MTAIIITLIIAATVVYTVSKGTFTITIKNINTTEIGASMIEYQRVAQANNTPEDKTRMEEMPTLDDITAIIRQVTTGGDDID